MCGSSSSYARDGAGAGPASSGSEDGPRGPRCSFPATPNINVSVHEVSVTGRRKLVSTGCATLSSDWTTAGPLSLTVELFEAPDKAHPNPEYDECGRGTRCGEVSMFVQAVDEPGAVISPSGLLFGLSCSYPHSLWYCKAM